MWDREFYGHNSSDVEWDFIKEVTEEEAIILFLSTLFAYDTWSNNIKGFLMDRKFLARFTDEELRAELIERNKVQNSSRLEKAQNELKRITQEKHDLVLREVELEDQINKLHASLV